MIYMTLAVAWDAHLSTSGKEGKVFFSDDKKQKTFGPAVAMVLQRAFKGTKVFWFFFSKKNRLLTRHRSSPGTIDINQLS